jgi:hypothetical protein
VTLTIVPTTVVTGSITSATLNWPGIESVLSRALIAEDDLRIVLSPRGDFRSEPSTSALMTVSIDEFVLLDALFDLSSPLAIRGFIDTHPWVSAVLVESLPYVAHFFGSSVRPVLEVVADPDAPKDQELFAAIPWREGPEVGRERLRAFDRAWWLSASTRSRNALNFGIRLA